MIRSHRSSEEEEEEVGYVISTVFQFNFQLNSLVYSEPYVVSKMNDMKILFVKEEDASPSRLMREAFETCIDILATTTWIDEKDIDPSHLTKSEYLIFDSFTNRDFQKYQPSKCAILGPLAITTCLLDSKPIPTYQWPIFNVAMYNCVVSCSNLSKPQKQNIKELVQLMGGMVTDHCSDLNTHLVTNSTKTVKYTFAVENDIKIMSMSWVEKVWEWSQSDHVDATKPDIIEKFQLPCLYKLVISTTGVDNHLKKKLAPLITENGGELVNKLKPLATDILICHGDAGTTSEKYKAARNVPTLSCVTIDWVYDSVKNGFALPPEKYQVIKEKTSTPTKEGENLDPNFSTISLIGGPNTTQRSEIDATASFAQSRLSSLVPSSGNKRKASSDLIEKLDLKKVKAAGQFLDGCSIFLVGFNSEQHEKVNKIVNLSGATRYNEVSDRVTHVIVGDNSCQEVTNIRNMRLSCALVSLQWLLDSIAQQHPAKEENYLLEADDTLQPMGGMGSPLSQRAVSLLTTNSLISENDMDKTTVPEPVAEPDDVLQQYTKPAVNQNETEDTLAALLKDNPNPSFDNALDKEEFQIRSRTLIRQPTKERHDSFDTQFKPNETSTQIGQLGEKPQDISTQMSEVNSEMPTEYDPLFNNLKFIIAGFDDENTAYLHDVIEEFGGQVVQESFQGVANYAVVPTFGDVKVTRGVQEIVNESWIVKCVKDMVVCDVSYYFRPLRVPDTKPLANCVVTTTIYANEERQFLAELVVALGGISQELFSRKIIEQKKVQASTHLISPEPTGKKYDAAVKWNLPVVNKDWLLECARTGTRIPENDFLLGNNFGRDDSVRRSNISNAKFNDTPKNVRNVQEESNSTTTNDTSTTSKRHGSTPTVYSNVKTPLNQRYNIVSKDTPETYSQITPVNKILQDAIDNNLIERKVDLNTPKGFYPWDPKTPESPLGLFIDANPSRSLRKEMQRFINSLPEFEPPRRLSTPLSEVKKRLWDKIYGRGEFAPKTDDHDSPGPSSRRDEGAGGTPLLNAPGSNSEKTEPESKLPHEKENDDTEENDEVFVEKNEESEAFDTKLKQFQEILKASGSGSGVRKSTNFESTTSLLGVLQSKNDLQSQICTVGWDYGELEIKERTFMISGVELPLRMKTTEQLQRLGAKVLDSPIYEESSTHLLCQKPSRNEKSLACMAAGKWILHISYVEKCVEAGKFLDEEFYEFGNPKSKDIIHWDARESINPSIHYWRKQVKDQECGAFSDMRAILVSGDGKDKLARVIEAGGGVIVNVDPPYDDTVNATHCLVELKLIKDYKVYIPLAQQGIKCMISSYIDHFLRRSPVDFKDLYVQGLGKYYK